MAMRTIRNFEAEELFEAEMLWEEEERRRYEEELESRLIQEEMIQKELLDYENECCWKAYWTNDDAFFLEVYSDMDFESSEDSEGRAFKDRESVDDFECELDPDDLFEDERDLGEERRLYQKYLIKKGRAYRRKQALRKKRRCKRIAQESMRNLSKRSEADCFFQKMRNGRLVQTPKSSSDKAYRCWKKAAKMKMVKPLNEMESLNDSEPDAHPKENRLKKAA